MGAKEEDLCKENYAEYKGRVLQNPTNDEAWTELRVCTNRLKRWGEASAVATEALKKNSDVPQAHLLLGIAHLHAREYEPAAAQFREATRSKQNSALPYYYLGMANLFLGHEGDAADAAEKAVLIDPQNAVYHSQLAYAYLLLEEDDKCESAAKKAIALDPNNTAAYKVLGNLYERQGKQSQSDAAFEAAIHSHARISGAETPKAAASAAKPGAAAAAAKPSEPLPEQPAGSSKDDVIASCIQQWESMRQAIRGGDIERALSFFSDYAGTRDQYRESFRRLGTTRVQVIFEGFGEVRDCEVVLFVANCKSTVDNGHRQVEENIRFERNPDKIWRIRSF